MIRPRRLAIRSLFLGVVVTWATTGYAVAAAVPWSSVDFEIAGDSIVGRTTLFGIPGGFSSIESQDMQSTSSPSLPIPGPADSDAFQTAVSLGFPGSGNQRSAASGGNTIGDPAGMMSLLNSSSAVAINNTVSGQAIKSQGLGTTTFVGEFVSPGGPLDFEFDGVYSLFAFHQNGAAVSTQRAEAAVAGELRVTDLTAGMPLHDETVLSQSLVRAVFGISSVTDVPFDGMRTIDLSGTQGNLIRVEWTTTSRATGYAARASFESQPSTGATASSSFGELNFSFSTIPEPTSGLLALLGIACLGFTRRGARRDQGRLNNNLPTSASQN